MAIQLKRNDIFYLKNDYPLYGNADFTMVLPAGTPLVYEKPDKDMHVFQTVNSPVKVFVKKAKLDTYISTFGEAAEKSYAEEVARNGKKS